MIAPESLFPSGELTVITRSRLTLSCVVATLVCTTAKPLALQRPVPAARIAPEFDIRDRRTQAESPRAAQAARELRAARPEATVRFDAQKRVRTVQASKTGLSRPDDGDAVDVALRFLTSTEPSLLDLDPQDVETLRMNSAVIRPQNVRHVRFDQTVDGVPVFNGGVSVHVDADGRVVRLVSTAASSRDLLRGGIVEAEEAVRLAAGNVRAELDDFCPIVLQRDPGPEQRTRMASGPLETEPVASLAYFPLDGQLRSAWHVVVQPRGVPQPYDVVVDGRSGRILFRHSRCRDWAVRN